MSDELEDLREENAQYHQQMQQLNEEMDRMLLKRDKKKKGQPSTASRDEKPFELRQLLAKNEQLRKERLKWWAEVTHSDTAIRISDTKNQIGVVEQQINQIKEEIRGLENIRKHQQGVVDVAKHAEDELRYLHAEHRQELAEFREVWRALSEENKNSEKILSSWQARYHAAQEKLKLNLTPEEVEELRKTVDDQGTRIEQMKQQVEELSAQTEGRRKQGLKSVDSYEREKQKLTKQLDAAKQLLIERERELKLSYARGSRMNGTASA